MKKILMLCLCFCSSCALYQIQTVVSPTVKMDSDAFRYSDSLVYIDYNLWSYGGQLSFKIYNKTEYPLYIDWAKSNFIFNGESIDYWKDMVVSNSVSSTNSVSEKIKDYKVFIGGSTTNSIIVTSRDKPQVQLPPKSFVYINKFNLDRQYCEDTFSYKTEFRNYISISKKSDLSNPIFIDNDFMINKIETIKGEGEFNKRTQYDLANHVRRKTFPNAFYTSYSSLKK